MPVFLGLKSKPWFSVGCFTDYKVVFWFGLVSGIPEGRDLSVKWQWCYVSVLRRAEDNKAPVSVSQL